MVYKINNKGMSALLNIMMKTVLVLIILGIGIGLYANIPSMFESLGEDCASKRGMCVSIYQDCPKNYRAVSIDPGSAKNPCFDENNPELSKELICCAPKIGHSFEDQVGLIIAGNVLQSKRNTLDLRDINDEELRVTVNNFAMNYTHVRLKIINSKIEDEDGCILQNKDFIGQCSSQEIDPKGVSNFPFPQCQIDDESEGFKFKKGNCRIKVTLYNSNHPDTNIVEIDDILLVVE